MTNSNDTVIPTDKIASWKELEQILNKHKYREWIYRGQADAEWDLASTLSRTVHYIKSIKNKRIFINKQEILLLDKFKQHATMYMDCIPDENDNIEWLSLMQHHGAPTRLLDWTFSPYIALFFALNEGDNDFALYCMKHDEIKEADKCSLNDIPRYNSRNDFLNLKRSRENFIFAYEPKFKHRRLVAQQGLFTIPSSNYKDYKTTLAEYKLDGIFKKIIISSELRYEWIKKIHKMNINSATLFPDLDGFCKSLKDNLFYPEEVMQTVK